MKKYFALFAAAAALAVLPACKSADLEDFVEDLENSQLQTEPEYVISIHEIVRYPKAESIERKIDCFFGSAVCVNTNCYLHSRNIKKIEMIPRAEEPGYYDLQLTLDKRGFMLWSSAAAQFRGRKLAFVIDGLCYRVFKPAMPDMETKDNEIDRENFNIVIEGPFDEAITKQLVKTSKKNYDLFN